MALKYWIEASSPQVLNASRASMPPRYVSRWYCCHWWMVAGTRSGFSREGRHHAFFGPVAPGSEAAPGRPGQRGATAICFFEPVPLKGRDEGGPHDARDVPLAPSDAPSP